MGIKMRVNLVIAATVSSVLLMMAGVVFGEEKRPLTPQNAAKKNMVDRQNEQRVTSTRKKAAAENLKAERLKIYKARQVEKKANHGKLD